MFYQDIIDLDRNPFEELSKSANFENVNIGRQGEVLVLPQYNLIPIIRTTYYLPDILSHSI